MDVSDGFSADAAANLLDHFWMLVVMSKKRGEFRGETSHISPGVQKHRKKKLLAAEQVHNHDNDQRFPGMK